MTPLSPSFARPSRLAAAPWVLPLLLLLASSLTLLFMWAFPAAATWLQAASLLLDLLAVAFCWRLHVRDRFGGSVFYLPTGTDQQIRRRNAEICALYNGLNVADLARQFGVSAQTIHRVIRQDAIRRHAEIAP